MPINSVSSNTTQVNTTDTSKNNKTNEEEKSFKETLSSSNVGKYTERGTRIVRPGEEMDKNAFLKILSAELSNQDPMNAKDGTEFVSQMAQFSGLEQMANLNTTMRLTAGASFVGKDVMLNSLDDEGNLCRGMVTGISKDGDSIKLNVIVGKLKDKDGNEYDDVKQFKMEDIIELRNSSSEAFYSDIKKDEEEKENEVLESINKELQDKNQNTKEI